MRILVTGAAGFIGSNLIRHIFRTIDNATVAGVDSLNDYYDPRLKEERLDSLMGYEIGMLRPHLDHILSQIPLSSVYRDQGDTILHHISGVQPLRSAWLPQHALYREFVPIA